MEGREGPLAIDIEKKEAEEKEELEERLRKQGWYLGEVTEEVATSILRSGQRSNSFAVYSSHGVASYILSARFRVEGVEEDLVEHLHISRTDGGCFHVQGQAEEYNDIIATVNSYVTGRDPPLTPALGKSFETQLSIPDDPPSYSQAERTLAPDIAPLPDVAAVSIEAATEAKAGRISPTGPSRRNRGRHNDGTTPLHIDNPHWYRYQDHCCLHPKNCWHCCCYRETTWSGRRERYNHKWYSLRGTGPLRLLGLLAMFVCCGLCIGCGFGCYYLYVIFFLVCCYEDS